MKMLLTHLQSLFQNSTKALNADMERLRRWISSSTSWPIRFFITGPRRYKVWGVIRRWILILFFATLWANSAYNFAETKQDANFNLQAFSTYLRFSADVFRYKITDINIKCKDCPPTVQIIKGEKDKIQLNLKQKNINDGELEERFYRYQILVTGNAEILEEAPLAEGLPEKAIVIRKANRQVNIDTLILFEPDAFTWPFRWLFAPEVFLWVAIVAFTFWTGFQIAALYVNFVFELDDTPSSRRFLLQSAFGSRYPLLRIYAGAVIPEDENKFVARVGGPGRVQIDYDSVAVFETPDGNSRIEGRTPVRHRNFLFLAPFERLRITLPTRAQRMNISLDHRTREGIPLNIRNIEARYNIARDGQVGSPDNPAPFDPKAVYDLVYNWGHTVKVRLVNLVQFQLRVRLMQRTFTELFAVIGSPDRENIRQNETELRELALQQGGIDLNTIDVAGVPAPHTRPEITNLFFEVGQSPVEIQWINVGTWHIPELLKKRHEEAWRITHENLELGKKPVLKALRRRAYREGLRDLIQDTPIKKFKDYQEQEMPAPYLAMRLLLDYKNRLLEIQRILKDQEEMKITPSVSQDDIDKLITILDRLLGEFNPWMSIFDLKH